MSSGYFVFHQLFPIMCSNAVTCTTLCSFVFCLLRNFFACCQIVLEADGYQPYLISPEKGLRSLIKGVLEQAKEPSRLCVDEVSWVICPFDCCSSWFWLFFFLFMVLHMHYIFLLLKVNLLQCIGVAFQYINLEWIHITFILELVSSV